MFSDRLPRALRRRAVSITTAAVVAATLIAVGLPAVSAQATTNAANHPKPTIVLVGGAWASGLTWAGEVQRLQQDGYPVVVAPNPARGLSSDAAYLKDYLSTFTSPIILVGHSYGGAVISNAATGNANVKALVYIDAYIPDVNDTVAKLSGPDSALAPAATNPGSVFTLVPYPGAPDGVADTYVLPDVFISAWAGDLPHAQAAVLAASQPPTSLLALVEPSGTPAWTTIPSWDLIGTQDKIIPVAEQRSMASHAKAHVVEINSAHDSLISHPDAVTGIIETAARAG
jgi:pimeloyl-ACP methyl ester carboxylesterase